MWHRVDVRATDVIPTYEDRERNAICGEKLLVSDRKVFSVYFMGVDIICQDCNNTPRIPNTGYVWMK